MTDLPAHAHCGPSSSDGWLNCCAYATLTRGLQRKATYYTREGSAAHKVAELMLAGQDIPEFIEIEGETILVTEEMIEYCMVYVQYAQMIMFGATLALVEARVSIDWLYDPLPPPEVIFGTSDLLVYDSKTRTLYVVDFKYGQGYLVKAKGNSQLMLYALMALALLPEMPVVIKLVIVQPRSAKDQISQHEMLLSELMAWFAETVKPALARIGAGDTSENPGDHCRWCNRASSCGALHKKAQAAAKLSFDSAETGESKPTPPPPASLSSCELSNILDQAEMISAWVSKVRAEAVERIKGGDTIPGFKLVTARGIRKWVDEAEAEKAMSDLVVDNGGNITDIYKPMELKSPAQMEKVLRRNNVHKDQLDLFVTKESTGVTLARDTDEREEVEVLRLPASSVFEVVE